jgi:O-antigen/teichoic acid export membrane protein
VAWVGLGVKGIFIGWLGALVVVIIIQMLVLSFWSYFRWDRYSPRLEREFLRFGAPLIAVNILGSALSVADRYIVGAFKGASQVGLYAVIYSLTTSIVMFLIGFIELGSTPVVTRTYENEGEDEAVAVIRTITRYFLMVMIPSMIGMWVLRHRIMVVITSPRYFPAQTVILPLVLGISLAEFAFMPGLAFNLKKKTRMLLWPVLTATALNIVLNLALVPFYGYRGAAWATLVSYVLYLVMMVSMSRKLMRWDFPWDMLAKTAAAAAIMGGALYGLNRLHIRGAAALALLILTGTAIYFGVLLAFGGLSREELAFGFSVVKRLPLIRYFFRRGE